MWATASDGTRLNFTVSGSGPPLVLVGGKTSTIEGAWWRYLPVFSRRFRTIALDNRGAGASDKPDVPYTTALMAEDSATVLRTAGEESAHWFGLSLGGMILQELALRYPQRIRSLILGATHCGGPQPTPPDNASDRAALKGNPFLRLAHLYTPRFILEQPDWVAEDASHFGKMPLHALHRQDQAVRHHDSCARLSEIRAPVLILHGRQDRLVPVERALELHRAISHSELHIVDDAGHQFHSEHAGVVLERVIDFIEQVERASSRV